MRNRSIVYYVYYWRYEKTLKRKVVPQYFKKEKNIRSSSRVKILPILLFIIYPPALIITLNNTYESNLCLILFQVRTVSSTTFSRISK